MIPTIRVKPWSGDQGPFVILNEEDFDSQRHELYVDEASAAAKNEETTLARLREGAGFPQVGQAGLEMAELARQREEQIVAEAEERARLEERKAAEEEAARQVAAAGTLAVQQALESGAPAAGAPPQSEGAAVVEPGTATGQPIAGTETGSVSAPEPSAPDLTVAKGPRGLFFLKAGDTIVSKGFPTEEEANAALAELSAGGAQ